MPLTAPDGRLGIAGERHFSQVQAAIGASTAVALCGSLVMGLGQLPAGYMWPATIDGAFTWGFAGAFAGVLLSEVCTGLLLEIKCLWTI